MAQNHLAKAQIIKNSAVCIMARMWTIVNDEFAKSKTPIILVDVDTTTDQLGCEMNKFVILRFDTKPKINHEVNFEVIKAKYEGKSTKNDRDVINTFLGKHCSRNKLYITEFAAEELQIKTNN